MGVDPHHSSSSSSVAGSMVTSSASPSERLLDMKFPPFEEAAAVAPLARMIRRVLSLPCTRSTVQPRTSNSREMPPVLSSGDLHPTSSLLALPKRSLPATSETMTVRAGLPNSRPTTPDFAHRPAEMIAVSGEQRSQKTKPQPRQWCRRRVNLNSGAEHPTPGQRLHSSSRCHRDFGVGFSRPALVPGGTPSGIALSGSGSGSAIARIAPGSLASTSLKPMIPFVSCMIVAILSSTRRRIE